MGFLVAGCSSTKLAANAEHCARDLAEKQVGRDAASAGSCLWGAPCIFSDQAGCKEEGWVRKRDMWPALQTQCWMIPGLCYSDRQRRLPGGQLPPGLCQACLYACLLVLAPHDERALTQTAASVAAARWSLSLRRHTIGDGVAGTESSAGVPKRRRRRQCCEAL